MDGFLPWLGGKHRLAQRIVERIERVPHTCYCGPFMGAAHVFFAREEPAKAEVLNDLNGELVTLFRVLQWHLEEFLRYFKWALVSRDEFRRQLDMDPGTLTDIQRAARFYYLQRLGFGGRVSGRSFGTSTTGRPRINLLRMEEELSEVHLRLAGVVMECLPWAECMARYDRPHTLFYIDPPYWGSEEDYGKALFAREDYGRMAETLAGLEARWLLSLNDVPEIRRLFRSFPMIEVGTGYSVSRKISGRRPVTELLISNAPFPGS